MSYTNNMDRDLMYELVRSIPTDSICGFLEHIRISMMRTYHDNPELIQLMCSAYGFRPSIDEQVRLVRWGLRYNHSTVRAYAMDAAQSWGSKELIPVLLDHQFACPYEDKYRQTTIGIMDGTLDPKGGTDI